MRTTPSQYAQALWEISQEKSHADPKKMAGEFLYFLRRKGESKKLARIVEKLEQLHNTQSQTKQVSVTTAYPVSVELRKELEVFAKEVFESPCVVLDMKVDNQLFGGVVLKTDNHIIDASVSEKMKQVRNALKK